MREMYAGYVARLGVSHERTLQTGHNLALLSVSLGHWDEATTFLRDQLLPAARQSLEADHHLTLNFNLNLAAALRGNPECTRDDLLEAEAIMQDVLQRRRRVCGPAHPDTRRLEESLYVTRTKLARTSTQQSGGGGARP